MYGKSLEAGYEDQNIGNLLKNGYLTTFLIVDIQIFGPSFLTIY